MRAYLLVMLQNSHAYLVLNKSMGLIEETCNVEFDENNGSQVEQSGTCDVGDEIPPQAIRRMGIGHIPLRNPVWPKEKDNAPSRWILHLLKTHTLPKNKV